MVYLTSAQRRDAILAYIRNSAEPVTGGRLSEVFGVTRQIIVADIAILKARGESIIGTPQGYMCPIANVSRIERKVAVIHSSSIGQIRDELYLIVDNGVTIQDVIVEHPLYGEITANLHITSRHDADLFLKKMTETEAEPLLVLTDGLHLHTLVADNLVTLQRVEGLLSNLGLVAEDGDFS